MILYRLFFSYTQKPNLQLQELVYHHYFLCISEIPKHFFYKMISESFLETYPDSVQILIHINHFIS